MTPADTLAAIAVPESTNAGLPAAEFPGLTRIQRVNLVGPDAANKQHASSEKRSLTLRERVNQLVEVVNQIDVWYLRRNGSTQKDAVAGITGDIPMGNHNLTGLPTAAIGDTGQDDYSVSRAQLRQFAREAAGIPAGICWYSAISQNIYSGTKIPPGFLLCQNQSIDSLTNTIYADLYNAIGTTYGGTGPGDFWLPPAKRFLVPAHASDAGYLIGNTGGEDSHILDITEMPSHDHGYQYTGISAANTVGTPASFIPLTPTAATTSATGGGLAHENRPAFIALNLLIKY